MKYTLSYINLPHQTIDLDKAFDTMDDLRDFVEKYYKNYTSYQVIVVKGKQR